LWCKEEEPGMNEFIYKYMKIGLIYGMEFDTSLRRLDGSDGH
jgi:hypothetical protein